MTLVRYIASSSLTLDCGQLLDTCLASSIVRAKIAMMDMGNL